MLNKGTMKKVIIVICIIFVLGGLIAWVYIESSKPLPGQQIADLGRKHIEAGVQVQYNSNPPTSGDHYADWIKAGVYELSKDDRYLVHSLEHGYIIISYNCDVKVGWVKSVLAHGIDEEATGSTDIATPSAALSDKFKSEGCHKLVDQLIAVYEKKGKSKIIIIPRSNSDTEIALTAWTRIEKFDGFDAKRIEKFIDAYRNMGPEKTMEP